MRRRGRGSFEQLFDSLYLRAYALAHRITGDQFAAEDATAEAFARAYADWRRLESLQHREAWILRVTANVAIDGVRRRRPISLPEELEGDTDGDAATWDLRVELVESLDSLPGRQRQAVALRYLGGLSEREAASALHISTNTLKTHVRRGLAALRVRLRDESPEAASGR